MPVVPRKGGFSRYLRQLHICGVSQDSAVGLLVASVADELGVPDAEVVLAVRPLREDGNSRSGRKRQHW